MARQTLKQEAKVAAVKTNTKGLVSKIKVVKTKTPEISLKTLEDTDLITKFTNGCELSYMELINRYETKVHNLAMRLTKNPEDAEEVLQDVFVTVYRKIESFEGKAKFSSWLYRITVNAAFMKLRKRKQDQSISLDDMTPHAQNKALYEKNTYAIYSDAMAINNQVREMLEGAITKLPDEYKAVFILRDIDGLSNKEVSEILTLSIPAVKSRLHRSRLMLRKKLRKFYNDYVSETKILAPGSQYKQAA